MGNMMGIGLEGGGKAYTVVMMVSSAFPEGGIAQLI